MKVAIIYVGTLRTIKKTMKYFKQNVLLHSDVNVFACFENDTNIPDVETWLNDELGDHLKSLEWFSTNSDWIQHREFLLNNMNISDGTKNYLRNGGSMISYYRIQRAYIKMVHFERKCNFKYDYVIKVRTDTIFGKPVDFHWLDWSNEEVDTRVEKIKQELVKSNIELSENNIISYFMNTIISDDIIPNINNVWSGICKNRDNLPDIANLNEYIKNGSYILTLRCDVLYIIRRDLFDIIAHLGTMYGYMQYHGSQHNDWWNSETQLESVCYNANITSYNYATDFDQRSICQYKEEIYFDSDYNIINPYMIFCVVRN